MSSAAISGRWMLFPVLQKFDLLSDGRGSVIDELGDRLKIDRKVSSLDASLGVAVLVIARSRRRVICCAAISTPLSSCGTYACGC